MFHELHLLIPLGDVLLIYAECINTGEGKTGPHTTNFLIINPMAGKAYGYRPAPHLAGAQAACFSTEDAGTNKTLHFSNTSQN